MTRERESFGGRFAAIATLAGSAIGLGNIWRFPYMVGEYGGAAFVLIYILASVFLSLPIFIAESVIGRRARANCLGAMNTLAPGSWWKVLGYMSIATPMIIVSYYSVVGGWSLGYLFKACSLSFLTTPTDQVSGMFASFISAPIAPALFHTIFIGITAIIVAGGVKKGIEIFSKVSIPILFILIILIMVYSLTLPGSEKGVEYLLKPDFSKITAKTCTYALGQSFYSLSLGMGIIITYSSFISKKENLMVSSAGTAAADLAFAVLAGFAIMPAVFAGGIEPSSGPGLLFESVPFIFSKMGASAPVLSTVAAILFFFAVFIAALTSSVSLMEVGVAYLEEEKGMKKRNACITVFLFTWILGIACALSFGPLSGVHIFSKGIFDFLDAFSSNVLLTIGGFLGVVFVGWKMKKDDVYDEFTAAGRQRGNVRCFPLIYFLIRYIAPIAVGIIFLSNFIM